MKPDGRLASNMWTSEIVQTLEEFSRKAKEGESIRDSVVFVHRSPLSSVVHGHPEYKAIMKDLEEVGALPCSSNLS